jgi:hypothetical protein
LFAKAGINTASLGYSIKDLAKLAAKVGREGFWKVFGACFGAGTPLLTPQGSKPIEEFQVGEMVLSRAEDDPQGPVEPKVVEFVFRRTGRIWHLHVGGQVIRTTAEHPFWVDGKGWVEAALLQVGDLLNSHEGRSLVIEDVLDTDEYETVYNLCIAEFHTYFVGSKGWGFGVWAHNTSSYSSTTGAGSGSSTSPPAPAPASTPTSTGGKKTLTAGELGTYGQQKQRTGGGLYDRDHIPSKGAMKERAAQLKGAPLTSEEARQVENQAKTVVLPKDLHQAGRTYGGKNTEAQIAADASNLAGAAAKDIAAHTANIPTVRPGDPAGTYKPALDQMGAVTNAEYDSFLKSILGIP